MTDTIHLRTDRVKTQESSISWATPGLFKDGEDLMSVLRKVDVIVTRQAMIVAQLKDHIAKGPCCVNSCG